MASLKATVFSLAPYHLMAWGTLLGIELYQSLVMTKLCYQHLPKPQFTQLQKHVFPAYFSLQTVLSVMVITTVPQNPWLQIFKPASRWTILAPLLLNLTMASLNLLLYGPRTSMAMLARVRQTTIDGRTSNEGVVSEAMKTIQRQFSRNHAMSIHLNAIAMLATVWYGFGFASRITIA
ncbi:Hypothetical protein R9X50_00686800 [Acrodontium crateriforme]|uniref:TMEM205-like domain-containing protein n=1 Tax=Acrodontium crateriforme TaxID=150365 RepID=A0AAQ3M9X8_9PEZI|nr:Hypothetical protein R9X50_00686800 [Acrodontium crateriforme]